MKTVFSDRRRFVTGALAFGGVAVGVGFETLPSSAEDKPRGEISQDRLFDSSLSATSLTGETADRVAIRRLIDAWAHFADRRLAEKQARLFTVDGTVENYQSLPQGAQEGETRNSSPSTILRGRAEIQKALAVLKKFEKTTHFNGQSDVVIQGDHAIGESYCIAHQLSLENGKRKYEVLSIRYQDRFLKQDGRWLFQQRKLILDWTDTRFSDI